MSSQDNTFSLMDENILQHFILELTRLEHKHRDEVKILLERRNFILFVDEPKSILERFCQRQLEGKRPPAEGFDDENFLSEVSNHQAALHFFLQSNEDLGYNWFLIDMSKGQEIALLQATAFILGVENIIDD